MAHKISRIFSFVGQNIKKIRQAKNISQSDFAAIFNLSRPTVGAYEEGRSEPKIETLIQISRHFSISIDILLTKELSSKDIFSLGLLNKKLDRAHEAKKLGDKPSHAPFVSNSEKVNFLVSRHDRSYMDSLPKFGVPSKLTKIDLVIEHEGSNHEIDNKGVHHGDYLFCQRTRDHHKLSGELLVLVNSSDLLVGRVSTTNQETLNLEFDNPIHQPLALAMASIEELYLVKGVYTTHTGKPHSMEVRLKAIEEKLRSL